MKQAEAAGKGRIGRNIVKAENQDYDGAGPSSRLPIKEEVEEKKSRIKNEMGQGFLERAGASLHSRLPVKEEGGKKKSDVNDKSSGSHRFSCSSQVVPRQFSVKEEVV
ncbi:hypothetical protein PM082_016417 [Marasmius tenuissimus]|nr:hypothetical protein PM082_016417 [Marasmius tenuissimus]